MKRCNATLIAAIASVITIFSGNILNGKFDILSSLLSLISLITYLVLFLYKRKELKYLKFSKILVVAAVICIAISLLLPINTLIYRFGVIGFLGYLPQFLQLTVLIVSIVGWILFPTAILMSRPIKEIKVSSLTAIVVTAIYLIMYMVIFFNYSDGLYNFFKVVATIQSVMVAAFLISLYITEMKEKGISLQRSQICRNTEDNEKPDNTVAFIYCPKCGTKILNDSVFCIKCGTKIDTTLIGAARDKKSRAHKMNIVKRIATNQISNVITIAVCLVIGIFGFNMGRDNLPQIETRAQIVKASQNLIDFTDSNPILGSSYEYKQDLIKYKADYANAVATTIIGYALSAISAIVLVYMGYNLALILKKRVNSHVL